MSKEYIRNHYIPQFILKNFSFNDKNDIKMLIQKLRLNSKSFIFEKKVLKIFIKGAIFGIIFSNTYHSMYSFS